MSAFTILWTSAAALSLLSLLARRPWTLVPAKRRNPPQLWKEPLFLETNMVITGAWTLYFALNAAVTTAVPVWAGAILGVPTPLLGKLSHRTAPRYVAWRLSRASMRGGQDGGGPARRSEPSLRKDVGA